MKKVEFKTSKGEFTLVDVTNYDGCIETFCAINGYTFPIHFQDITEEQAKEVVSSLVKNEQGVKSYVYTLIQLLQANGVVFENPLGDKDDTGHNARDREWS